MQSQQSAAYEADVSQLQIQVNSSSFQLQRKESENTVFNWTYKGEGRKWTWREAKLYTGTRTVRLPIQSIQLNISSSNPVLPLYENIMGTCLISDPGSTQSPRWAVQWVPEDMNAIKSCTDSSCASHIYRYQGQFCLAIPQNSTVCLRRTAWWFLRLESKFFQSLACKAQCFQNFTKTSLDFTYNYSWVR